MRYTPQLHICSSNSHKNVTVKIVDNNTRPDILCSKNMLLKAFDFSGIRPPTRLAPGNDNGGRAETRAVMY
ncbi:hypothetical protein EVAR_30909_1 [Eumeta japonica]|uniref:Uncharacterized protein n=1 Tax=Eumeta variegata TaxID=151549 RepID=A0A4C1V3G4_EUMVA|nr:hypothetical protein EVAR_30909_1 [Eumeta japonica]